MTAALVPTRRSTPPPTQRHTPQQATELLREHLPLTVTQVKPLAGGRTGAVYEWITDGQPAVLVVKLAPLADDAHLRAEFAALQWYHRHTTVPVPQPYGCITGLGDHTCLLTQRLPGRPLGLSRLSSTGRRHLQRQLAHCVAELHKHRRHAYGCAWRSQSHPRWLDRFAPSMQRHYHAVRPHLSARADWVVAQVLAHLEQWLPETHQPTLVHGDLWAHNIIVDDLDADRPILSGLIDGGAEYADVEYELAYLLACHTADATFFHTYAQIHPLRDGFESRCLIYWLDAAMHRAMHVDAGCLSECERLAQRLYHWF